MSYTPQPSPPPALNPLVAAAPWRPVVGGGLPGLPNRDLATLDLRFDKGEFDSRILFTRASTAGFVGHDGILRTAPLGIPRFEYSSDQSNNWLTYSEDFSNAIWTKGGASISANATAAPNGMTTADLLTEDGTTGVHRTYISVNWIAGPVQTVSVYVKANGRTQFQIEKRGNETFSYGTYDLTGVTATMSGHACTGTITDVGSGWFLCTLTARTTVYGGNSLHFLLMSAGTTSYTGDTVSGMYFWGAQLRNGREALPYVQTISTQAKKTIAGRPRRLAGLKVEPQITNLNIYSEQMNNAAWSYSNALAYGAGSVIDSGVAPDGTTTAELIVWNTNAAAQHQVYQTTAITVVASTVYTFSCFIKASGYAKFGLRESVGGTAWVTFDIASGAGLLDYSGITGFACEAFANDWYRVAVTYTHGAGTTARFALWQLDSAYTGGTPDAYAFTADGTSGLLFWGAQLELSPYATSYIPTVAASVTRSGDTARLPIGPWCDPAEATVYCEFEALHVGSSGQLVEGWNPVTNGGAGLSFGFGSAVSTAGLRPIVRAARAAVLRFDTASTAYSIYAGLQNKMAMGYSSSNAYFATNGFTVNYRNLTTTVGQLLFEPGRSHIAIGFRSDGSLYSGSLIGRIKWYRKLLDQTAVGRMTGSLNGTS